MPVPNTPNYFAVQSPVFAPAMRNILSITNDTQALITTTFDGINPGDNGYESGLIVRIYVPNNFGMTQINKLQGIISVVNSTQFTITIDTTNFDPFVVPTLYPGHNATPALVVPIGEINEILTEAVQNILPPQI